MATSSSSISQTISMEGEKTDSTNPCLSDCLEESESQVPGTSGEEVILEVPTTSPLAESQHSGEEIENEEDVEEGEEEWLWGETAVSEDDDNDDPEQKTLCANNDSDSQSINSATTASQTHDVKTGLSVSIQ